MLGLGMPGLNAAFRGGGSSRTFFARTGCTYPWYTATTPNAIYVSETDTTWIGWETNEGEVRAVDIITYNHTTLAWTYPVRAVQGAQNLANDDHGVPAICRDHEGHVHIFFGAHIQPMDHVVTISPDDPTRWRANDSIGEFLTYPHPHLVGSSLYLFARSKSTNHQLCVLYKSATLSGGAVTWDAPITVVDYGVGGRFYSGNHVLSGAKIHVVSINAHVNDDYRRNVHYWVYDTATGNVENVDGSVVIAAASLPVSLATMNASFMVYENVGDTSGNIPALCFDDAGAKHVLYMNGAFPGTSWPVYHTTFAGGVWTAGYQLGTSYSKDSGFTLAKAASGGVMAAWTEDAGHPHGGDWWMATRTSGGAWGASALFRSADIYALGEPNAVLNGHADARLIICETQDDSVTEVGTLKGFCIGATREYLTGAPPYEATSGRFNPADMTGFIALLSNGRSAQQCRGLDANVIARALFPVAAGEKKYCEFIANLMTTGGSFGFGIANASHSYAFFLGGSGDNSHCYYADGANYLGGANQGTTASYTTGDNIGMAVDRQNNKIWFRKNNGNWNNDVIGNQNPATNTGGFDISAITGNVFASFNMFKPNERLTANFTSGDWIDSAPSGFSAIG